MKIFTLTFLSLFSCCCASQDYNLLVGTYDSPKSDGIYVFRFSCQTGTAAPVSRIATSNPSFLAVSPDERYVYAVAENAPSGGKGGEVVAYRFNKYNGSLSFINRELSGGDHPCHVETDHTGRWVFVSNYSSGTLSVYHVNREGSLGSPFTVRHSGAGPNPQRQKGPHVHGARVSPDNRQLLVTDLGTDRIMLYDLDTVAGKLSPSEQAFAPATPGSGPRLLTFHPRERVVYVIEELTGTVAVYKYRNKRLKQVQRVSTVSLPTDESPGSADIHVSPDGKFLYASNRGNFNNIAIFRVMRNGKLQLAGEQPVLGKTPRNFSLDPTGRFLLCANQNSDEIVVFGRDTQTGMLQDTGNRISVGKPVCLKWIKAD